MPAEPEGQKAQPLRGVVRSGRREAAGFVSVPWVRQQLHDLLGRDPYPGTLNLQLREPDLAAWRRRASTLAGGLTLPAPDDGFCDSTYFPVLLNASIPCQIVLPHVAGYPPDVVELVAGENLRDRLGLRDGDEVSFILCVPGHTENETATVSRVANPCDHALKGVGILRGTRTDAQPPPEEWGRRGPS